ncbi:winged helix-turn-helix transcriptional regulator [Allorhizocola rhizosphaerae]|uniref:winged helix-turn-helix transcriptional regulator n=1 Tax=Allorhizocola rhizosphaerae TaxID=1872709 RepID=UPI001FE44ACC|nr:winged helix-turn-helix transcriptional regulator [Allorhizocola rhizosphaerae]
MAHSLDVVGDRWAMLVVRELRLGPRRFNDLQVSLPKAGPNVLTQRLRDLEVAGVLRKHTLPAPARVQVYELTEWGAELEPVFQALARWGMRSPNAREGTVTNDTVMLGTRTFWPPESTGWDATLQVSLGRDTYRMTVVDGRLTDLARGEAVRPDTTVTTDQHTFNAVLNGELALDALAIEGDREPVRRLVKTFSSVGGRQEFQAVADAVVRVEAAQAG